MLYLSILYIVFQNLSKVFKKIMSYYLKIILYIIKPIYKKYIKGFISNLLPLLIHHDMLSYDK